MIAHQAITQPGPRKVHRQTSTQDQPPTVEHRWNSAHLWRGGALRCGGRLNRDTITGGTPVAPCWLRRGEWVRRSATLTKSAIPKNYIYLSGGVRRSGNGLLGHHSEVRRSSAQRLVWKGRRLAETAPEARTI